MSQRDIAGECPLSPTRQVESVAENSRSSAPIGRVILDR